MNDDHFVLGQNAKLGFIVLAHLNNSPEVDILFYLAPLFCLPNFTF